MIAVALRKESVDRNTQHPQNELVSMVALRKESVDRNVGLSALAPKQNASLSARRAWIEMSVSLGVYAAVVVALRKESVDRNA